MSIDASVWTENQVEPTWLREQLEQRLSELTPGAKVTMREVVGARDGGGQVVLGWQNFEVFASSGPVTAMDEFYTRGGAVVDVVLWTRDEGAMLMMVFLLQILSHIDGAIVIDEGLLGNGRVRSRSDLDSLLLSLDAKGMPAVARSLCERIGIDFEGASG